MLTRLFAGSGIILVLLFAPLQRAEALQECPAAGGEHLLRIGARADAAPFSYRRRSKDNSSGEDERPFRGYTVDLCHQFARELLESDEREYCYSEVTAQNRFDMLASGEIDMLCGATTATLNVRARFETSLYTFLTATTFIVREEALNAPEQNGGEKALRVGYLKGTTSAADLDEDALGPAMNYLEARFSHHDLTKVPVTSHDEARQMLASKSIDLYVSDRPILTEMFRDVGGAERLRIHSDSITLQPYAVVFRKTAPPGRPAGIENLAYRFNRFLIERFRSKEYQESLVAEFKGDLDIGFVRLLRIQSQIPIGAPIDLTPQN